MGCFKEVLNAFKLPIKELRVGLIAFVSFEIVNIFKRNLNNFQEIDFEIRDKKRMIWSITGLLNNRDGLEDVILVNLRELK